MYVDDCFVHEWSTHCLTIKACLHMYVSLCVIESVSVCERERQNVWSGEGKGGGRIVCAHISLSLYLSFILLSLFLSLSLSLCLSLCLSVSLSLCLSLSLSLSIYIYIYIYINYIYNIPKTPLAILLIIMGNEIKICSQNKCHHHLSNVCENSFRMFHSNWVTVSAVC